jgi:hypothetical protein
VEGEDVFGLSVDGSGRRRSGLPPRQVFIRAGRRHDDPDLEDGRLGAPPAVSLRRRVHRSAFIGVFAFTYVFTQTLLDTHPDLQVIK